MTVLEQTRRNIEAGSMEAADFAPPHPSANGHAREAAPVRLNLGSGPHPLPGFDNIDRKDGREVYPLDYPDGSVDEVRSSHCLEHFSHRQVADVLREWVRVLKPGGILRVAVPDFHWIASRYLAGEPVDVQRYTMGAHSDENDWHATIFDTETLSDGMRMAGLWDIRPWKSELPDCASLPVSLNLQGKKKSPIPPLKVAGAISCPRLGFNDNFMTWFAALAPLGIVPTKYDGAFWGQCLERVMSEQLEADYILTVDYDSVFTRDNAEHLIRLAAEYPTADAIAPLQIRRQGDSPLVNVAGPDGRPVNQIDMALLDAELVPVLSAHFGMTLIKTEALKRMAHPWFLGVPNAAGEWGEGRLDDDSYFWVKWKKTGNSLFLAPHVVIGHAQLVITWPDRDMKPTHQHTSEFWGKGMPENVWK